MGEVMVPPRAVEMRVATTLFELRGEKQDSKVTAVRVLCHKGLKIAATRLPWLARRTLRGWSVSRAGQRGWGGVWRTSLMGSG